jgi:nitrate/nitrite transporter NarK
MRRARLPACGVRKLLANGYLANPTSSVPALMRRVLFLFGFQGGCVMLHEPAAQSGKDLAASYKMRLGVWMFLLYSILYGGFVAINLAKPLLMEETVFSGLNLAVVYGFGLIIIALIQALVYDAMCNRSERSANAQAKGESEK